MKIYCNAGMNKNNKKKEQNKNTELCKKKTPKNHNIFCL